MIYKSKNLNKIIVKKSTISEIFIKKMYNEINLISKNIDDSIIDIYDKSDKIYIEKKTTIKDGLNFNLHNALLNCTHDKTTSYLNFKKQNNISRQAYENRSNLFTYDVLKQINDNLFVNNLSKKNINNNSFVNNNKDVDNTKTSQIDGTNINVYDKTEDLGYKQLNILGLTNNNSNSLLFTNKITHDKKSEINLFYELIKQHPFEKKETIVVDKLYFSKKFIKACDDKNLKFIARIKYNSIALAKFNDFIANPNKKFNYDPFNYIYNYYGNIIRIVSFKTKNEYINIATNINKKNVDYFKKKYGDRWNVEIFFKHIKKNSSINKITSHDLKTINNIILSASINQIIIDRILYVYNFFNTDKKKTISVTNFYYLYKTYLMFEIINNKLSYDAFYNIIILNVSFYEQKINKEKTKERYGIMPGTKWHYKYICNITKEKREKKKKDKQDKKNNDNIK